MNRWLGCGYLVVVLQQGAGGGGGLPERQADQDISWTTRIVMAAVFVFRSQSPLISPQHEDWLWTLDTSSGRIIIVL